MPSGSPALMISRNLMGYFDKFSRIMDRSAVGGAQTPSLADFRAGVGVGVRYDLGFGPIRADVGLPLNRRPSDPPFGLYVSLGQAF